MRQFTKDGYTVRAGDFVEYWNDKTDMHVIGKITCISRKFLHISGIIFVRESDGTATKCIPETTERHTKMSLINGYNIKKISQEEYFSLLI